MSNACLYLIWNADNVINVANQPNETKHATSISAYTQPTSRFLAQQQIIFPHHMFATTN